MKHAVTREQVLALFETRQHASCRDRALFPLSAALGTSQRNCTQRAALGVKIIMNSITPGLIVLLGSGETLPSSGKIHEFVAQRLPENPRIAILETPAGFEPNSDLVAGKIKDFLLRRLQNYQPTIEVLPARQRGTLFSPNNAQIAAPILEADEILLGPGSPTYGVRQLQDSLALEMIKARQRLGGVLFLSSSAPISFGRYALPVYEIYKAGFDLHWVRGLDLLSAYGLPLSFVTHWNNNDGGNDLDTSRCYIGQARFEQLLARLPSDHTIVGIDEHTALVLDFEDRCCQVLGNATITILRAGKSQVFRNGDRFALERLGEWHLPANHAGISPATWEAALKAESEKTARVQQVQKPPPEVLSLAEAREAARADQDWITADDLRVQLADLGWQVKDTPEGSRLAPLEED
jgi:hypothetical protein